MAGNDMGPKGEYNSNKWDDNFKGVDWDSYVRKGSTPTNDAYNRGRLAAANRVKKVKLHLIEQQKRFELVADWHKIESQIKALDFAEQFITCEECINEKGELLIPPMESLLSP